MDDMIPHCDKNTIYVLNSSYEYGEIDVLDLFGTPAGKALNSKQNILSNSKLLEIMENQRNTNLLHQTKLPQITTENLTKNNNDNNNNNNNNNNNSKIGLSDKTQKSLCKLNLFIKRLKLFNLFNDHSKTNKKDDNNNNNSNSKSSSSCSSKNEEQKANSCHQKCFYGKNSKKSTKELYREAAKLLGINCTLSDNCRCIECQSRYFDCSEEYDEDDSSDDEYDDDDSDTDSSCSSGEEDHEHIVTNCYLIHTEQMCDHCTLKNSIVNPSTTALVTEAPVTSATPFTSEMAYSDVDFHNFIT